MFCHFHNKPLSLVIPVLLFARIRFSGIVSRGDSGVTVGRARHDTGIRRFATPVTGVKILFWDLLESIFSDICHVGTLIILTSKSSYSLLLLFV